MTIRRRVLGSATLALLLGLLVLLAPNGWGQGGQKETAGINPVGKPAKFDDTKGARYAVWYADEAWHLRVVAPKPKKGPGEAFEGSVRIEGGKVAGGDFQGLEKAKKAQSADWVFMHADGRGLDFRFLSSGKVDAINVKPSKEATGVSFRLLIGGNEQPQRVLIGAQGKNPEKIPFSFPAHPTK
jgi:hypothetical protein